MPPKFETFGVAVNIATGLTRRGFVKAGGALFVSLALPRALSAKTDTAASLSNRISWIPANSRRGSRSEATVRFWRAPAVQKSAPA